MGRSRTEVENKQRTLLQNNTGTMMVSLPISEIRRLGWRVGQKVRVNPRPGGFTITAYRRR